ncbi:MAG: hypothetical protein IPM47_03385 [Sphingobacteriales bacterium]|nr:MAG: hypothetical protein IPM47_03385 [Sphingobacteriales bacterium]
MKLTAHLIILALLLYGQTLFASQIGNKREVAQSVFDDLVNTYSDNRLPPKLELLSYSSAPSNLVADYVDNPFPVIRLSEKAYDVCVGMGKDSLNALAVILSHELAHHYKSHSNPGGYAFSSNKPSNQSKTYLLQIEKDADETGAFFAYLAGYNSLEVQGKLIDRIYAVFGFPDKVKGYPTKDERKKASLEKLNNLQKLLPVFETGEVLFTLNKYTEAADCFIYIANKFPSKEMYYNAGVAKLMQAIELFDVKELPFAYPVELEAKSRLTNKNVREVDNQSDYQKKRQDILKEAELYLEKACKLNPDYTTATISLACVYDIQGKHTMSIQKLDELLKNKKNGVANAYVARGIAKMRSGLIDKAKQDLQLAINQKGLYAQPNYDLLNNYDKYWISETIQRYWNSWFSKQPVSETTPTNLCNPNEEFISNKNPVQLENKSISQISVNNWTLKFTENNGIWVITPLYNLKFIATPPNYSGSTGKGIKAGNTIPAVELVYGKPSCSKSTTLGSNLVYQDCRIIFVHDKKGKIQKWILYKIE